MNVDWVVAIAIFLILFSWSMFYYTGVLRPSLIYIPDISEQLLTMIRTTVWTVPVRFTAENATNNSVLYASLVWPSGTTNSTRVWNGSQNLPCNITDSRLYWQANLSAGDNYFWITYANHSQQLNCSAQLNLTITNLTIPWPAQTSQPISTAKLDQMLNSDYTQVRSQIGRNFQLTIDWLNGTTVTFGPPATANVLSRQVSAITDTGQLLKLGILMW